MPKHTYAKIIANCKDKLLENFLWEIANTACVAKIQALNLKVFWQTFSDLASLFYPSIEGE